MRISLNFRPPRLDYVCVCSIGMCLVDVPILANLFKPVNVHPGNCQRFNPFPFFIYIESLCDQRIGDSGGLGSTFEIDLRLMRHSH